MIFPHLVDKNSSWQMIFKKFYYHYNNMAISFNIEELDKVIGGKLEEGIITNCYGEAGSGKSNMAMQLCTNCIRNSKKVIYVDTENGFTPERFIQMHKKEDLNKVHIYKPKTFDEQLKTTQLVEKDTDENIGLVIVDSIVSLYRLILHDNIADANYKLTKQFYILSGLAESRKIPVFVTNQVYADFDTGDVELVGRDIPKYFSKTIIKLEKTGDNARCATLTKHRFMPEGKKVNFEIKEKGLFSAKKFGFF